MSEPSIYRDKELFSLIADGDEAAFRRLFDIYVPSIKPVVKAIVHSEEVVKDLIQDVFVLLWVSRAKMPDVEIPEHWIFRIVHYECYRWLRQQRTHSKAQQKLSGDLQSAASVNTIEEYSRFKEVSSLLKKAIDNLPPQAKLIYQMRRERDMAIEQVAAELSLAPKTVKNTLTRALQSIQKYLEEQGVSLPLFVLVCLNR